MLAYMSTALTRLQQELDLNRVGESLEAYLALLESDEDIDRDALVRKAWREVEDAHHYFHLPIRSLVLGLDFALHLVEDDNILFQVLISSEMPEAYREELQAWKALNDHSKAGTEAMAGAIFTYGPHYLHLREELQNFITQLARHRSSRDD